VVAKTRSDCAEPFIGEYLGMGREWDATTRATRACWGAAAMARARRWSARQDRNGAEVGQAPSDDWVRVRRSDKARCAYRVAVPDWARDVRGTYILDIEIGGHLSFASGPFDIVLTCFGSHRAEFAMRA